MKRLTVMDMCKIIVETIQENVDYDIFTLPVSEKDLRLAIKLICGGDHRTLKAWKEHLEDFGFMREVNQYAYSFREGKKHFKLKKLEMFSKEIKGENDVRN